MSGWPPLIVDGPAPHVVPAFPLPFRARGERCLFVFERTIYLRTRHGWLRIPRGYVTDFGSIPTLATAITFARLRPLDTHAWAAIGHDWLYAIGQPGYRALADDVFLERCEVDGVNRARRELMYRAIRWGGADGYGRAPSWWAAENFAEPSDGAYPVAPPFARQEAFVGGRWGLRELPDWAEAA